MKKFTIIDHTADLGIEAYGKTLNELFENSAYGMFSQITDIKKIKNSEVTQVKLKEHDTETLLITWLNELQYHYSVKKMLFKEFRVNMTLPGGTNLSAIASGEKINNHRIFHDIKAATYHDLRITRTPGGYKTRIIFDV